MRTHNMKYFGTFMAIMGLVGVIMESDNLGWVFIVSAIWSVGGEICERLEK